MLLRCLSLIFVSLTNTFVVAHMLFLLARFAGQTRDITEPTNSDRVLLVITTLILCAQGPLHFFLYSTSTRRGLVFDKLAELLKNLVT